jgi:UDP-N-acetylglucosamine transferase subunit ALG13
MSGGPETRAPGSSGNAGTDESDPEQRRGDGSLRVFVTVGTELPFDRLVGALDDWAGARGYGDEVVAQIGHKGRHPKHIGWREMIEGVEFDALFDRADVVVAHAGMGTILRALERARPLIVVPRQASLGEHRNDHQLATVERLTELGLVHAADTETELIEWLDRDEGLEPIQPIGPHASESLLQCVRDAVTMPST